MSTLPSPKKVNHRVGRRIEAEGDLWFAHCWCGWVSYGFDTMNEAKTAHLEHVASERMKP